MKARLLGTLEPQAKFFIQNTWKTEQLLLKNISSQMNRKNFLLVKWPHHLLGACKYIESISYWLTVFWHFNLVKFLDFRTQLCTKRKLYASLGYNHRWACQIHQGGIKIPARGLFYLRAMSYVANFLIVKYIVFWTQSNIKSKWLQKGRG